MGLTGKNNEEKAWNFLKGKIPNDFGVAGLMGISIHALLAESDWALSFTAAKSSIFLSTLSLRRATSEIYPSVLAT